MGPATTWCDSPIESLKWAMQMFGKGYADVVIVNLAENGKVYGSADFNHFCRETRK
jgi:hypothetical protein